jgi:uncharacterized protein YjbI with pentapeptide repeats
MEEEDYKAMLHRGDVESFNKWREKHPNVNLNLRGEDLSSLSLNGAFLLNSNLKSASFRGSSLLGAIFCSSNLSCTDFSSANLEGAQFGPPVGVEPSSVTSPLGEFLFKGAVARRAQFGGACIKNANFRKADLTHCSFKGAVTNEFTSFEGATLDHAEMPQNWYHAYLARLNQEKLKARWGKITQGIAMTSEDLDFLREYAVVQAEFSGKEVEQEDGELVKLVQSLISGELPSEELLAAVKRLHILLVSSQAEENIQKFVQCNGHAVMAFFTLDDVTAIRCIANCCLVALPSHHSKAAREFTISVVWKHLSK